MYFEKKDVRKNMAESDGVGKTLIVGSRFFIKTSGYITQGD